MTIESQRSPSWGTTTKLVIGLTLVAILAGIFIYYRSIVSLLVLASIITYLFQPLVAYLTGKTRLSWRVSTTLVFLIFVILLIGLLTGAGLVIAQQATGLVRVVQEFTNDLPDLANDLTAFLEQYGIKDIINLSDLANRLLETIQPLLGQAGSIVGSLATGAAASIGRIFFIVFVAYFILSESQRVGKITFDQIPQYGYDIRRMTRQLSVIWESFFRGQFIIFVMVFVVYLIILSALGVRYSIALAALTGLAVFVPYVGSWTASIVMVLVTFLQPGNYFGLLAWQYAIMVLAISLTTNFIFDNYITPRFLGRTLDIHPAAVLVAALAMASLMGVIGIFLAAPVVATLKLLGMYVFQKMFDLDPWPEPEEESTPVEFPWFRWSRQLKSWFQKMKSRKKPEK
ncbi:MAG: AI-2E family transporter [Anaerolineales bacterium]|nr:AI-2E family transporter [Anaerolineales bacterium]